MKKLFFLFAVIAACFIFTGCRNFRNITGNTCTKPVVSAKFSRKPVEIDGRLDDPVWKTAKTYEMKLSKEDRAAGQTLHQPGQIQVAWNEDYLYIAARFVDSDIVAEGKKNQMHHYKYGDVCEVFLKPSTNPHYRELYVTPLSKRTTFFFPSGGYLGLPSCYEEYEFDLTASAHPQGTVNNYKNKDTAWTAEMRIPVKVLRSFGDNFGPESEWKILIGRYNYSVDLRQKELTMHPRLSVTNFHRLSEYALLKLEK